MKKSYIAPVAEIVLMNSEMAICAASPQNKRTATWGGDDYDNQFVNPDWHNQGYDLPTQDIEDDNGQLGSMAKGGSNMWDE